MGIRLIVVADYNYQNKLLDNLVVADKIETVGIVVPEGND